MKRFLSEKIISLFIITFQFCVNSSYAGEITMFLRSGNMNISSQTDQDQLNYIRNHSGEYAIITFNSIPGEIEKSRLSELGIHLFGYLPKNSFYAFISEEIGLSDLKTLNIFALSPVWEKSKFHSLISGVVPDWAVEGQNINLIVSLYEEISTDDIQIILKPFKAELLSLDPDGQRAFVSVPLHNMKKLGGIPVVYFIEPVDPPSVPENYGGRSQHRSNMLAQEFNGGTKFNGSGVSVGMHDDGIIGPHIDYTGRLPIQFPGTNNGNHGDHVAGTIMGAGNLDPQGRGMAFGADLYVYSSNDNNYDSAVSHYNTYNVVITSKSYSNGCNAGYTSLTQKLDQQVRSNASLIHVFSAGNEGTSNCSYGAGAGWGNITGGHKMGKNVIATGNLNSSDQLAGSSSRGPASDGRIKPDICAKGTSVFSTIEENNYDVYSGTSMACPGISGSLAQLYQAYKSMNSGQNPPSALIKGCVLNTADDIGNPGPDFKFGWGRINLRRALNLLENNQYISASITSTGNNTHNVSIPANVNQVRIMIYYHDYEATTTASRAIVNNLDMTVTDPSNNVYLPWVLNPAPNAASLDSNAKRAVDSLNNMEQITLDFPAQGNYTVTIKPTAVPQGPQPYFIVYEYIFDEIYLTYPNGGEGLVPGETETIRWDAPAGTSAFALAYSLNSGLTWTNISTSVSSILRHFNWNVPNSVTGTARIKISRGLITDQSDADFSIIGVPDDLQVDWVCPDSVKLSWNNVTSATSYRVYKLGPKYMDSVSTTTQTEYVFKNAPFYDSYWFSVSANPNSGYTGRRAVAIQSQAGLKNCPLKNDATLSRIISPQDGTYLSCVGNSAGVKVSIRNDGINTIQNIPIVCEINGSALMNGTYSDSIQAGDSGIYTFGSPVNISNSFQLMKCYVNLASDSNPYNDSASVSIMSRPGISVTPPWSEDFENFFACGIANNCGNTRCVVFNGWSNDSTYAIDDHDWRTDNDGTASGQTGPDVDHNPGSETGYYLYTEASSECNYKKAQLMTPCLDLSGMSKPRFTFWYHMYGVEMGEIHLDLQTSEGWVKDIISRHSGNLGDVWLKDSIDLTAYAGEKVSVRFRGITGSGYRSDMAIDDINLFESDPYIGVDKNHLNQNIRIYPNPSSGIFHMEITGIDMKNVQISISDLSGKLIDKLLTTDGFTYNLDLSSNSKGLYFLKISTGEETIVRKLIKN